MTLASHLFPAARRWRPPDKATPPEPGSRAASGRTNNAYCAEYITSPARSFLRPHGRPLLQIKQLELFSPGLLLASVVVCRRNKLLPLTL